MASFGCEISFECAKPLIRKEDCLVVLIHWKLLAKGFSCIPPIKNFDEFKAQKQKITGSELLPKNWNQDPDCYELHYTCGDKFYLLKAIIVDNQLVVTVLRRDDEHVVNLLLETDTWVGSDFQSFTDAYINRSGLETTIDKEIIEPLFPVQQSPSTQKTAASASLYQTQPKIPRAEPSSSIYLPSPGAFPDVGRGDLNPLGGFGSGMLMDPRHPWARRPQVGIPDNLPPGAVPPGARFDPFGPPDIINPTRGPRPRGGFGDPNPDHLRPPEW